MNKKCIGCGSVLQTSDTSKEGYVKESVYDKSNYCQRCFKIMNYGEYTPLDNVLDEKEIINTINNDKTSSVAFLVDSLNISETIKKYINKFKNNKYILITKKDVLPSSIKENKIIDYVKNNICNTKNIMCISSFKNYNIDEFLSKIDEDNINKLYVVGFTNSGKSTFINHLLTSVTKKPSITTSSIPNTTASYIKIKFSDKLTIIDTPGFIDSKAIYNFVEFSKICKLYPKKEIRIKTFQMKSDYSIVVNDFLRIDNIDNNNSFSFYMNDSLRYEKVKIKNCKLKELKSLEFDINEPSDILINGLGFIRITKVGKIRIYIVDSELVSIRKSMI